MILKEHSPNFSMLVLKYFVLLTLFRSFDASLVNHSSLRRRTQIQLNHTEQRANDNTTQDVGIQKYNPRDNVAVAYSPTEFIKLLSKTV